LTRSKKILIIAYHFPPDASVGALRPAHFARHLPEHGWQPYILTIKDKYIGKQDAGLLAGLDTSRIVRTRFFRSLLDVYAGLKNISTSDRVLSREGHAAESADDVVQERSGLLFSLKCTFLNLFRFPDDRMFWFFPAVWRGFRLIRQEKIRYIFATSPPHTVDLIGMALARLTGARLLTDHRDPWAVCKEDLDSGIIWRLRFLLERLNFTTAATVITTTELYTEALRAFYTGMDGRKFITITNGFDSTYESVPAITNDPARFVMTYLGNFYLGRNPLALLRAVRDLAVTEPGFREKVEVRFVGAQRVVDGVDLGDFVREGGIGGNVVFMDQVPHDEAMRLMAQSDLLLLFAPNQYYQIPAKTYEYLAVRKPILALTGEGATAEMVKRCNAGLVVPQDDLGRIAEAVLRVYRNPDQEFYRNVDVSTFSYRHKSAELAAILEGLALS
jgi:glycosyltransferase involved in cell wall biosynthesis